MSGSNFEEAVVEVRLNHRKRGEAWGACNLEGYFASYWDDALVVMDGAPYSIEGLRAAMVSFFESGGRPLSIDLPQPAYVKVGPSGDVIVTSFTWRERLRTKEGAEQDLEYSESDVWVRREGRWRLVLAHLNHVQDE